MNAKLRALLALAGVALISLPTAAKAQTNGFVLQCLSAVMSGSGCVTRAQGDASPTSLFRDPAGLVAFDRPTLEINIAPFMPSLTFKNAANPLVVDGATHAYPMASIAYVGRKIGKLSWAVGMEPIGGFGSDFHLKHALLSGTAGSLVDYKTFFAAAKFGPSFAYQITPRLSVGGSVSGVYAQIRDFRMPFTMPPTVAKGLAGIPMLDPAVYGPLFQQFTEMTAYGNSKAYSGLAVTGDAGIAYRAPNGFAWSVSWTPKRGIDTDGGTATIDMTAQFGQMMQAMVMARAQAYNESPSVAQGNVMQQLGTAGLNLAAGVVGHYDAATTLTLPQTIGAGVSIPVDAQWKLSGELEWREWSKAEGTMPFKLTKGDNANLNLMLNANPTDGRFTYPFPLDWKDALTAKVGVTYEVAKGRTLRGGLMYGQNPVPDNTVFITFPAISTTAATIGTTWTVRGLPISASYVHAFSQPQDGSATGHKIGHEYQGSHTTMSENVFTFGATWRY